MSMLDWPEHSHTSPNKIFPIEMSWLCVCIRMVWGFLLPVVLMMADQLPLLSAITCTGSFCQDVLIRILSPLSAHPHTETPASRWRTIFEEMIAGNRTPAYIPVVKRQSAAVPTHTRRRCLIC